MNRRTMLIGFFILLPSTGMAEQNMGRLFFTPEQRGRMDVAREQERSVKFDLEQEESAVPPANLTLNGVITRSDGRTTVWINNKIQGGEKMGLEIAVPQSRAAGQIRVTPMDVKRSVPLKVGQSIDMSSGQVEEGYRRAPPAPPKQPPVSPPMADTAKSPATHGHKGGLPDEAEGVSPPAR